MKLSILDQSIVRLGATAGDAIAETIATVQRAERLGYHRFWVSEHHNSRMIAGSTPEVLMVKLADVTARIRIGSGGIMLPNHSALKVAENFRMLETLFPGRIDLGIGRAPGTDRITSQMLNPANTFSEESYIEQLAHLQAFFKDEASTQYGRILAVPQAPTVPQQWILSSSGGSSIIAAKFGLGLAIARFINGQAMPDVVQIYRDRFEPSESFPKPHALLAIQVLCADTEEKAAELRKVSDYVLLQFERGKFSIPGSYDEIRNHVFTDYELERIRYNSGRIISGTKESVKEQLLKLADSFGIDEVIVSCMTTEPEDRARSFELLAEAFELKSQ
ncbi:MAG: LLM class flavin-dependent oxidoreductase [Bacteroidota bacterium]